MIMRQEHDVARWVEAGAGAGAWVVHVRRVVVRLEVGVSGRVGDEVVGRPGDTPAAGTAVRVSVVLPPTVPSGVGAAKWGKQGQGGSKVEERMRKGAGVSCLYAGNWKNSEQMCCVLIRLWHVAPDPPWCIRLTRHTSSIAGLLPIRSQQR